MNKPKLCVINFNGVIPDMSDWFEVVPLKNLLQADALLTWNEVVNESKIAVRMAMEKNIPAFIVQHGVDWGAGVTEVKMHNHETYGCHYFVWSEDSKEKYISEGIPEKNITVSGCSLWPQWEKTEHPFGNKVLFAPMHSVLKSNKSVQDDGVKFWHKLNSIKDIDPSVKLLMGEHKRHLYPGKIVLTNRFNDFHIQQSFKALNETDVVVIQEEGTFALMAYSLNKPVIKIKSSFPLHTGAPIEADLVTLEEKVKGCLKDPKQNEVQRMIALVNGGGDPLMTKFKSIVTDKIMESITQCV